MPTFITASLNARLQPMHRGESFEDALDEVLRDHNLGHVSGGGTMVLPTGEVEFCDIEIQIDAISPTAERVLIETLEQLGAPKGSKLVIEETDRKIPFGTTEGLAVYLNGTDLPDEVYANSDSNFVYEELERLLGNDGRVLSYWQGPTETALYLYGLSFETMRSRIDEFVRTYPLCQGCRIERIA